MMKLAHIKISDFMALVNWCNQLVIHFTGLACTNFSKKPKNAKIINLLNLHTLRYVVCATSYTITMATMIENQLMFFEWDSKVYLLYVNDYVEK